MNRFAIDRIAGAGGMGTVYRAHDHQTGEAVALKVLKGDASQEAAQRFVRESRVLAHLRHPNIVRYVADGRSPSGEAFIAMEWLDGESLAGRLARGGLTAMESIDLVRRVAETLGAAHERGIVHRDVKPSNLFLVDGDLDRVKVLDFGVARITDVSRAVTQTGAMIGTPGYMAPEQVRGDRDVNARADVFALGCVLYECLTGRAAFVGEHVLAVLAKILLEESPRLRELRPDLPFELDELLGRVLNKSADARPRDGVQLAIELDAIGIIETAERPPAAPSTEALTASERRLLSVVLISNGKLEPERTLMEAPVVDATWSGDLPGATVEALTATARAHEGQLQRLADSSYVVTLTGTRGARDQAATAARCALALKSVVGDAHVALATGHGVIAGRWPVGQAIDRAVRLVAVPSPHVRIDDVTAGLLDTRFDVGGDAAGLYVFAEHELVDGARTLLGVATQCVGRERELAMLLGLYDEAVAEPLARAVLVTGVEGIGKSRLRHEALRRMRERPGDAAEVWVGRGDPLRAGAPYGMIAPALRRAAGIQEGEPAAVRRQKLRARVMRNASGDVTRTVLFLGELIGTPFPDDGSVELRAARQDPMLMNQQVQRAFEHFLALETAAQPVILVLEDLHWGDLPTVKLLDAALRELPEHPWLVLALARPSIHEQFPRLWAERGLQELRLEELTKRGAEKLVRNVLGPRADADLVARLVERSGGNAFFLEELLRAVVEGKNARGDAMPETVLALVQGRLERLESDARQVLRAASVFGRQFWRGGVTALLGGAARGASTKAWLDELVEREVVSRSAASRYAGEDELMFRHAIVRDAAYAMLTDADRELGHRLAAEWLESIGESDALVLAEHYERAGERTSAASQYARAAQQAANACDWKSAIDRGERGIACGAAARVRGELRLAQAEAYRWSGAFAEARRCSFEAMGLLPPGHATWFTAAGEAAESAGKLDDGPVLFAIGAALRDAHETSPAALPARLAATAQAAYQVYNLGNYELGAALIGRIEESARLLDEPGLLARVHQARSARAMFAGDVGAYLESELAAANAFERAGDLRFACMQRGHVGYACLEIGAYAEAERNLREVLEQAMRLGLSNVVATAKHNLGRALRHLGLYDEALAIEREAVELFRAHGDRRLEGASLVYLGQIREALGDLAAAEADIRAALPSARSPMRPYYLASLASVLLASGRNDEALDIAREANTVLAELGAVEEGEAVSRLVYAEALLACGERDEARVATLHAMARIDERAARISDPEWRRSFLERIPEIVRTFELARMLGLR